MNAFLREPLSGVNKNPCPHSTVSLPIHHFRRIVQNIIQRIVHGKSLKPNQNHPGHRKFISCLIPENMLDDDSYI
jgi:hypothetical protein